MLSITSKIKIFYCNEDGIATVWAMFWLIICFALGGLAIDTANAWKIKQILQSTADSSSVSAAMEFYFPNPERDLEKRVKLVANTYADANMNQNRYGDVLPDESIFLGHWDGNTFTPDKSNDMIFPNAVRVITEQVGEHSLGTYFLRFISIFGFEIRTGSTTAVGKPICEGAAIFSEGNIMIAGQNSFKSYCLYGLSGVDSQASNYFGDYSYVGMPNILDCGSGRSFKSHCYVYGTGGPGDYKSTSQATSEGFDDALWSGMAGGEPETFGYKLDASNKFFDGIKDSLKVPLDNAADEFGLQAKIGELIDGYLIQSTYGDILLDYYDLPREGAESSSYRTDARKATQTDYLSEDKVVIVPMKLFQSAEISGISPANSLFDVIVDDVPTIDGFPDENYVAFATGTTYIVDCSNLTNSKMNMGRSGSFKEISGIAIIGLDCDYTFDSTISYSSAFITTTSTSGLNNSNGQASITSSSGVNFGTTSEFIDNGNEMSTPCTRDRFTLLSQGSMKIGAQLTGSNFDLVSAGAVRMASGSSIQELEPHVGSSISAGGDVKVSSHQAFSGCGPWTLAEGDLGTINLHARIVQ